METTKRNTERAQLLFEELGGAVKDGFPTVHSQVHHTRAGTPYLKTPGARKVELTSSGWKAASSLSSA